MKRLSKLSALALAVLFYSAQTGWAVPVHVNMGTSLGAIELELYPDKAPKTVANFLRYARAGKYDGTIFHRVIPDFMIQGGGFDSKMQRRERFAPIPNEADNGLLNSIGTVAMARTSDPHSASNQFFINTHDNGFLNFTSRTSRGWGYAVFGRVTHGMSVVRRIQASTTGNRNGFQNVPLEAIEITHVEVVEDGQ